MNMSEFSWRTRRESLDKFKEEVFDVLVIGGGITGAGIALDASARGLRTALVEKRDFAAGTSSRSTKLIHGGLRYLEHLDFLLVREGLRERAVLTRIAPHLVDPFPFVVPIYRNNERNYDHPLKMRAGLVLYDLLAGRYGFGNHRHLSYDEALKLAPQLDRQGLKGAFLYYDALTDDARLVIEVIKAAHELGSSIANYTCVTGFIKDEQGKVAGARLRDELTGDEFTARSRIVINATGVWMNDVAGLASRSGAEPPKHLRPSKGIHLTVPAGRLPVGSAWLIPSLKEHRFYFVVPWHGRVNIGTTDNDYAGDKDSPHAENDEVIELLDAINAYFPAARLKPSDVISSWAGLRPLISDKKARKTADISRKEELFETEGGLISISGGKLTTYRLMAERTVSLAAQRLSERFSIVSGDAGTNELPISGGSMTRGELARDARRIAANEKLSDETSRHLAFTYGSNCYQIIKLIREQEHLRAPVVEGLPQILAEVVYAAQTEMAMTLADALVRRTRLAILAGEDSVRCSAAAAELMARELEWDDDELKRQIAQFTVEFEREYAPEERIRN
jgi:glycerol-3-phosphate dehydrogenase